MDTDLGSPDGRFDVMASACPTREVVACIGDKWSLLVLYTLSSRESLRFTELRRGVEGITQKMLTQTLRRLERDGLVERYVHAVVPPRVDYSLTELGSSLSETIAGLRAWAYANMDAITAAREAFDGRAAVGGARGSAGEADEVVDPPGQAILPD